MGVAVTCLLLFAAPDGVAELAQTIERNEKLPYEQRDREKAIFALGRIGSAASTKILIDLLDDPFAHQRDNAVSALITLKKKTPEERAPSLRLLATALRKSRSAEIRIHIATALGLIGDARAASALSSALGKEKDPVAAEALATGLGRLGGVVAVVGLRKTAEQRPHARAACIRSLGYQQGEAEFIRKFAKDGDDAVRAAVVEALARLGKDDWPRAKPGELQGIALADALPKATDASIVRQLATMLLAHPSWRVRSAAIQAIEIRRVAGLFDLLIDRMEKETGRLRFDAWMALRRLTGRDIPLDAAQWRAVKPLEIGEISPDAAKKAAEERKSTAYFGLPVVSERIAFVFDVSGSMRDDGKMDLARKHLAETAAKLGAQQRYDLFVLRYLLDYPPRPKLVRAFGKLTAGKSKAASAWLKKQPAKGGGAIYDTLVAAMDDPEVDTIYLLSDGVPSYGSVKRDYRVLQEVRRKNRWRRVAIHTILLGTKGTDRRFMRDLARENQGSAVDAEGQPLR
ncbi:MAG: HEAT repeat domain-containing protein [Planctomycetota bacterium]|jgi:HEAT repeat protein